MISIKKNDFCGAGLNTGSATDTFIPVNNHIASIIGDGTFRAGGFAFFTESAVFGSHMNSVFPIFMGNLYSCFFRVKNLFVSCSAGQLAKLAAGAKRFLEHQWHLKTPCISFADRPIIHFLRPAIVLSTPIFRFTEP